MTALRKLLVLGSVHFLLAVRHGRIEVHDDWRRLGTSNCSNDVLDLTASNASSTLLEDRSAVSGGNLRLTDDLGDLVHLGGELGAIHDGERLVINLPIRDGLGEVILARGA